MKKILVAICIALGMITTVEARGCGPCGPGGGRGPGGCRPWGPPPPPCGPGWGRGPGGCRPWGPPPPPCGPGWGRGGRNFWPSFVGGVAGAMVGNALCNPYYGGVVTTPVVGYTTPAVVPPVVYTQPTVVAQTAYTAGYSTVAPVTVTQPVTYSSNTTIVNPTPVVQRAPLVGASVNILGIGASVGIGY